MLHLFLGAQIDVGSGPVSFLIAIVQIGKLRCAFLVLGALHSFSGWVLNVQFANMGHTE